MLSYYSLKLLGLLQSSAVEECGERKGGMMAALTTRRTLDPSGYSANSFKPSNGF